ncbi:MAG: ATP-binding protein, partial [Phycisphaerales bacterium]|nr:ATP-binding protein [Phycisphaerales bacterium]
PVAVSEPPAMQAEATLPLESIKGQESAKRALIVSAAGWHNLIMLGPPGCGKTLMARALADLLPPLDRESLLEILQIRSCAGHVNIDEFTRARRPVRTPHHTASGPAIIGGGTCPHPGEVSLAHHGILFLDELPEFGRRVLEALRQPLEDHAVTVSRVSGTVRFPARFLLVAAANPSYRNSGLAGADQAYMRRLSSPLLDRVDLHVEVRPVPVRRLKSQVVTGPATDVARKMIRVAVERQHARQGTSPNGMLDGRQLDEYARLSPEAEEVLAQSVESLGLSARGWDTIRRVARTIADLDDRNLIEVSDVVEAVSYRLLDRTCGP